MKLQIATEGVELTPEIKSEVEKKLLRKISKYFKKSPADSVGIDLRIERNERWGFKAKCRLDIPGQNIYSEGSHKELFFAITSLADDLERRLRKQKEKSTEHK